MTMRDRINDVTLLGAAGLDDGDRKRATRRRVREQEAQARRLADGFAALNGEGVYGDDEDDDLSDD